MGAEVWPHPTGLLQEFGLIDYSMVPRDRLEYKRVLGMAVDLACNYLDNCNLDKSSLDKRIVPYVEAYEKFCRVTGFEVDPDRSQKPLSSRKWRFCGTNDMIGLLNDELVLVDRKCTWTVYAAAGPQLAAYQLLAEENYGIKIRRRFALQLKETGNYDLVEFKEKSDFVDFQACLYLHWQRVQKYKNQGEEYADPRT